MALIKCKECGKEISSQAAFCPSCGYPMKHPIANYQDITHGYDRDRDYYYDEKNHRMLSEYEYTEAKDRYLKERDKIVHEQNLRTQELIKYINDPNEIEELKLLRLYVILSHDDISRNYSEHAIKIMKNYLKDIHKQNKSKKKKKIITKNFKIISILFWVFK